MKDATTHPLFVQLNEKHLSGKEVSKDEISSLAWHLKQDGFFTDQREAIIFINLKLGTDPIDSKLPIGGMAKELLAHERERDEAVAKYDREMAVYIGLMQSRQSLSERIKRAVRSYETLLQLRDQAAANKDAILEWPKGIEWTEYDGTQLQRQISYNMASLAEVEHALVHVYPVALKAHEEKIPKLRSELAEIEEKLGVTPKPEAPPEAVENNQEAVATA